MLDEIVEFEQYISERIHVPNTLKFYDKMWCLAYLCLFS